MALGVLGAALVLMWFAGRLRLGARARSIGGVRSRIGDRMADAVGPSLGRAFALGTLVAVWFGGWRAAPLGPLLGWLAWRQRERIAVRARVRDRDAQIPEAMRAIAAGVRAGGNVRLALGAAGEELPEPIAGSLRRCAARCDLGASLDDALARLDADLSSATGSRFVETLRVGAVAGAALPGILLRAADELDERLRLERDRRAASAQVRLSALVIGAMPLVFLALAGPAARGPGRVLLGQPIGWMLLVAGLGLDAAGWGWMRRIGGEARP